MGSLFKNRYYGHWQMTLDRYMSGSFLPLFGWSLLLSTLAFLAIWLLLTWLGVDWTLGDAFIQLSNPSSSGNGIFEVNYEEWFAIVITNLFGLFVINGIILTLLVNWVSNRKEKHEKGEARYGNIFRKRFGLIIGGHKIVGSLTRDLLAKKNLDFILIQTQRPPVEVRKEITAEIKDIKKLRRVIIYSGERTSRHEIEELHPEMAQEIYIIGEPSAIDHTSHDSISLQTWNIINESKVKNRKIGRKKKKKEGADNRMASSKIPCHIMFEFQSTFTAFQYTDVEEKNVFRFIPFSIYENWAQQVLINEPDKNGKRSYLPLDGLEGISYESDERVHLIVVGMSKMGISLALEASHLAHYPNFNNPKVGNPRTLITFIDKDANTEMLYLMGRFKALFNLARWRSVDAPRSVVPDKANHFYDTIEEINKNSNKDFPWNDPLKDEELNSPYFGGYLGEELIDIDFEFIKGDVALPSIQQYIKDACADKKSRTTIAVCFPIAVQSMSAALYFDPSVYREVQQIWVLQPESGALADTISGGQTGKDIYKFEVIRPFGMIEKCDYLERIHSPLPKIVSYGYTCGKGEIIYKLFKEKGLSFFKDEIEKNWLQITRDGGKSAIAQRWSNIYCANSFPGKLRSIGKIEVKEGLITDERTLDLLAKTEHNRWVIEQLLLGFRPVDKNFPGSIQDIDKAKKSELKQHNIHPNIVSNEKLTKKDRAYDEMIVSILLLARNLSYLLTHISKLPSSNKT